MKKQKIQFIVMLILLVVVVAAFFGIRSYNAHHEETKIIDSEPEYTVLDLAYDDVESFSFANENSFIKENGSYSFERVSSSESENSESINEWSYLGDTSLDLDSYKVSTLLDNVLFIQTDTRIEDVSDWEQYGLSDSDWELADFSGSDASVSITTIDGKNYRLLFGDYNEFTEKYYLSVSGEPYVYVLDYDIGSEFLITPDELAVDETEDTESDT